MGIGKAKLLFAGATAVLGIFGSAKADIVFQNSFELVSGDSFSGNFETVPPANGGTLSGGAWTVAGSVDWIQSYWPAEDGSYSIDLQGGPNPPNLLPGSITSAKFSTNLNQVYTLTFYMSGNPDGADAGYPDTSAIKVVDVSGGNGEVFGTPEFSYSTAPVADGGHGNTDSDMQWALETTTFVGSVSGLTSLTFASGNLQSPFGAALDNVSITTDGVILPGVTPSAAVPVPSAAVLGMAMFAGFSLIQIGRRRWVTAAI